MVGVGGRIHVKRCECCRKRKVKCDGQVPACKRCIDHGLQCPGYERKLEFIYFDGRSTATPDGAESQKDRSLVRTRKQQHSIANRNLGSPSRSDVESRPPRDFRLAPTNIILVQSLAIPQNKLGLMTVLHGRYVPEYHDASSRGGTCASWITTACGLTSLPGDSEMLSDSLLAMSFSLIGSERQQDDLSMSGLQHYSKALKGLRNKLVSGASELDDYQMDASLITCLACGMYEVMANRSYSSLLRHLDGVGALLRARGIKNITTSTSRRTFYEYRSIKLSLDLATRRASFLSTPEWIDPPWKALEPHSANNLQTVSDIAFRIPLAMEKLDHAHNALHLKIPDVGWDDAILRSLILEALSIHSALEKWVYRLSSDRQPPYYTTRPARTTKSSIIDSIMNIYPISFEFPNWDSASSFVYHSMSQIYINSLLLDLEHLAQTSSPPGSKMGLPQINARELIEQSIECADRICQSIEYFLEDNKRLIGRMVVLAPFETTRSLFNQLSKSGTGNAEKDISLLEKVGFCDAVTQRIKDSGLPIG